jgi:DNA-binding transcriptional LysR family regulator
MASARAGRPLPFRFANGSDELEMSPSHRLVVNDTNSYLAAGLVGLGIIQAPAYAVHAALQSGQLVAVLDEWRTGSVPVHVIYPPNRYLSAKVRVFIDWTVALFERHEFLKRG